MTAAIDATWSAIAAVARHDPQVQTVRVLGSRAMGTARPGAPKQIQSRPERAHSRPTERTRRTRPRVART